MCVAHMDDGGSTYTTCECPTTCPAGVNELVCSYYNTEFNSLCEMHKYGCAHDLTMKVKNEGSCPTDSKCLSMLVVPSGVVGVGSLPVSTRSCLAELLMPCVLNRSYSYSRF